MMLQKNSYLRSLGRMGLLLACAANAFMANTPVYADAAAFNSNNIQHVIVIYQENWPFDGLYGSFPGANGLANAGSTALTQIDKLTGNPLSSETGFGSSSYNNQSYTSSQIVFNNPPCPLNNAASGMDGTFLASPGSNPITSTSSPLVTPSGGSAPLNTLAPYDLSTITGVSPTYVTGDIYHRYWSEEEQINGGAMNKFVSWSDDPGLVMSHFDATNLPEGLLAQQYTICDNFFHSAFGGSFLNHQFLVAAQAPVSPNAPQSIISVVDPVTGHLKLYGTDSAQTITINNFTGGTTVTVANTVGMYAGQTLSGTGTALDGATVASVTGATSFTLTAGVTATYSGTATANPKAVLPGALTYGKLINDSKITPIGAPSIVNPSYTYDKQYAVNTIYSINFTPSGTAATVGSSVIPSANDSNPSNPNYYLNIGDLLSQANVSWKWYSGGWNTMMQYSYSNPAHGSTSAFASANASLQVQWHHQAMVYFDNYAPFDTVNTVPPSLVGGFAGTGTGGLTAGQTGVTRAQNSAAHIQDETNFFTDVSNNTLPAVTFIKNVGVNNEHPGYTSLQLGQAEVATIVQAVESNASLWAHTVIIITYDEHGGRWDHVTPPTRDAWGPGERVPLIVISPYAKRGYVDHNQYDTTSILSTIEQLFLTTQPAGQYSTYLNTLDQAAPTFAEMFTNTEVTPGSFTRSRSGAFSQPITVTNLGSSATASPVYVALDNLSSNTSLTNRTGTTSATTPTGSPYILVTSSPIAAGASATVTLQFSAPTSGGITYSPRAIVGTTP